MPKAQNPNRNALLDTWGRRNRKHEDKSCAQCGEQFRPKRADSKYCSRECSWSNNGGHNKQDETWWINAKGYVDGRITLPDGSQRRVKQHRWIMENHLGRDLLDSEDAHHINGIKTDNRVENLQVLDRAEHSRISNSTRSYKRGYQLSISALERKKRSERMKQMRHAAIDRAKGEA